MIISDRHVMSDLKELWSFRSFRARIILAIFPTLIALIFSHFAADRQRPYDFHVDGSFILPPAAEGGDQITVHWKVTRHRQCEGIVERQLVDPRTDVIIASYDPAPAAVNGVPVGSDVLRKEFTLPLNLQKGEMAYQAKLTYTCNWLQKIFPNALGIKYVTPPLKFTVKE